MANKGLVNYGANKNFASSNDTTAHINLCNEHKYHCFCLGGNKMV